MKKITMFVTNLSFGSVEKQILSLCMMLEDDYEIELVSMFKIHSKPIFPFSNKVKITYLVDRAPGDALLNSYWGERNIFMKIGDYFRSINEKINLTKLIIDKIKSLDSDYIIGAHLFPNHLISKYAKKGIIKIAHEKGYYYDNAEKSRIIKWNKGFDYIVTTSMGTYNDFKRMSKVPCVYIPNVLDDITRCHSELLNNELTTVGKLIREKAFDEMIDVIKIVKNSIPDIKLHLIGDGILNEEIQEKIKLAHMENNILMHGYLKLHAIDKIISESAMYVCTNLTEVDGVNLLESMSHGVPCIVFDSAKGAIELVKHNHLLIPNRDKNLMAAEIVRLLNNRDELRTLGKEALEFSKDYMAVNIKQKWIDLLNK